MRLDTRCDLNAVYKIDASLLFKFLIKSLRMPCKIRGHEQEQKGFLTGALCSQLLRRHLCCWP